MAIGRGESVGEAYIRIHADGSGLPDEIKDQFATESDQFENAGRERGEIEEDAYNEARAKQRDKNNKVTQKEIEQQLKRDSGRREALEKFLAGREGKAIREGIRKELGRGGNTGGKELADRIFTDIAEAARRRGNTSIFGQLFGSYKGTFVPQGVDESLEDFAKRQRKFQEKEREHSERQSRLFATFRRKAQADLQRDIEGQAKIEEADAEARRKRLDALQSTIEKHFAERDKIQYEFDRDRHRADKINAKFDSDRRAEETRRLEASIAESLNYFEERARQQYAFDRDHHRALKDNVRFDEDLIRQQELRDRRLLVLQRAFAKAQAGVFAGQSYHNRRRAIAERAAALAAFNAAKEEARRTGDFRTLNRLIAERNELFANYSNKLVRNNGLLRGGERATTEFERSLNRFNARYNEVLGEKFNRRGGIIQRTMKGIGRSIVENTAGRVLRSVLVLGRGFGNVMGILRSDGSKGRKALQLLDLGFTSLANGAKRLVLAVTRGLLKLTAFFVIAGPLAALISMLAGAIVALSSTIIIGLVGAAGAAVPVLFSLAAAGGVVALAFAKMDKETKKDLAKRFAPVTREFKALQGLAREGILGNLDQQIPRITKQVTGLAPLVQGVSKAVSGMGDSFLDALEGADQKENLKVFTKELPIALGKLGRAFSDVFVGALNYIRALFPAGQKLLTTFETGSKRFREFSGSAAGQNKIKTYMDGAWKSAKILGTTLKLSYRVLRDLTNAGKGTGDSIFGNINKNLQRYDEYLTSSKGRKEVKEFFSDVEDFMGSLGRFTGGLARLFGSLDDETSRGSLNAVLDIMGDIGEVLGDAMPIISAFTRALGDALSQLKGPIKDLLQSLRPLIQGVAGDISLIMVVAVKALVTVLEPLITALAGVAKFVSDHKDIFQPIIVSLLLLKGGLVLFGAGGLAATLATRITSVVAGITGAANRGAGNIRTSALRVGGAVAGLGLALAGFAAFGPGQNADGSKKAPTTGGAIGTVATGAAAGALVGSAFGPVGTAVGGIIGTVGGLVKVFSDSKAAGEDAGKRIGKSYLDAKTSVEGFASALAASNGLMSQDLRVEAVNQLSKNGALGAAGDAGLNPQDLVKAGTGDAAAAKRFYADLNEGYENGKISIKTYNLLSNSLNEVGQNIREARRQQLLANEAAGKGISTTTNLKQLTKTYGTSLDELTTNGITNNQWIKENVSNLRTQATSLLSVDATGQKSVTTFNKQTEALKAQLRAAGFLPKEIDRVVGKYAKIPKEVITKLEASNRGKKVIADLGASYAQLPETVRTKLLTGEVDPGVVSRLITKLGRIPTKKEVDVAIRQSGTDLGAIATKLDRLSDRTISVTVNGKFVSGSVSGVRFNARGRILTGPTLLPQIAGEAGPEAIVPLRRPLAQVDKSVRALSAFAQGIPLNGEPQRMARGGFVNGGGKTVSFGDIIVNSNTSDPYATAHEVVNAAVSNAGIA